MDIDDEDETPISSMKVAELRKLTTDYIEVCFLKIDIYVIVHLY